MPYRPSQYADPSAAADLLLRLCSTSSIGNVLVHAPTAVSIFPRLGLATQAVHRLSLAPAHEPLSERIGLVPAPARALAARPLPLPRGRSQSLDRGRL